MLTFCLNSDQCYESYWNVMDLKWVKYTPICSHLLFTLHYNTLHFFAILYNTLQYFTYLYNSLHVQHVWTHVNIIENQFLCWGHASKNAAGGLISPLRTIHLGKLFCDTSNARRFGMPPAVFRRLEAMSDSLNAAFWNPYYAVKSTETRL